MRVLLATGFSDLEKTLTETLNSRGCECFRCYHRSVVTQAVEQHEAGTVVIGPALQGEQDLVEDVIVPLRQKGVRVIFLPGEASMPDARTWLKELVPYGIYCYIFDPVTPASVLERLEKPGTLGELPQVIKEAARADLEVNTLLDETFDELDRMVEKKAKEESRKRKAGLFNKVNVGNVQSFLHKSENRKQEDRRENKKSRVPEVEADEPPENSTAEKYLYLVAGAPTRKKRKTAKISVISPSPSGATFIAVNLAYTISLTNAVTLLGDDCEIYKPDRYGIVMVDSLVESGEYIVMDKYYTEDADMVVVVYDLDLGHLERIKEVDTAVKKMEKIRVLNSYMALPISASKVLGFEPDVIVPHVNNYKQILLARPAAMDCPEVEAAMQSIIKKIKKIQGVLDDRRGVSQPAVFS